MNTEDSTPETTTRPLGYWLRAVDRLLAREFATAFEAEGASRRDWRLLALLDASDDDVMPAELADRLRRRLDAHGGKKLRSLVDRGWVTESDGSWTLTDEGRAAKARLAEAVDGLRARVSGAVSEADFATTLESLEAIAREFGWNAEDGMPRGFGRRGFDRRALRPRFPGFGPREGFGPGCPHGHAAHGDHDHSSHGMHRHNIHGAPDHAGSGHHPGPGAHRAAQEAYERGFDAGFARGRDAA